LHLILFNSMSYVCSRDRMSVLLTLGDCELTFLVLKVLAETETSF
jgi:hypothetical protein